MPARGAPRTGRMQYFLIWENMIDDCTLPWFYWNMELAVNALRALADPVRIRIVHLLWQEGSMCVCQIAAVTRVPYASLSKHLHLLKYTGLVTDEKKGRWVYYSIPEESWNPSAASMLALVSSLAAQSPEVFAEDAANAKRVTCCSLTDVAKLGPRFLAVVQKSRKPKGVRT